MCIRVLDKFTMMLILVIILGNLALISVIQKKDYLCDLTTLKGTFCQPFLPIVWRVFIRKLGFSVYSFKGLFIEVPIQR
jgi:hypothetical protein